MASLPAELVAAVDMEVHEAQIGWGPRWPIQRFYWRRAPCLHLAFTFSSYAEMHRNVEMTKYRLKRKRPALWPGVLFSSSRFVSNGSLQHVDQVRGFPAKTTIVFGCATKVAVSRGALKDRLVEIQMLTNTARG